MKGEHWETSAYKSLKNRVFQEARIWIYLNADQKEKGVERGRVKMLEREELDAWGDDTHCLRATFLRKVRDQSSGEKLLPWWVAGKRWKRAVVGQVAPSGSFALWSSSLLFYRPPPPKKKPGQFLHFWYHSILLFTASSNGIYMKAGCFHFCIHSSQDLAHNRYSISVFWMNEW